MDNLNLKIMELAKIDDMEKIEELIEDALNKEPNNIDLLLRLAVLEIDPPFSDYKKSIALLNKVLTIDENNALAMLLIACANYYCAAGVDEKLMNKLNSINTDDNEINSILKYAASWFYKGKDPEMEENLLKESINLFQGHVYNYVYLAKLYFNQGRNLEARALVEKALKNVVKIYTDENLEYDPTDVNEFLNERIKGIYLTEEILDWIKNLK